MSRDKKIMRKGFKVKSLIIEDELTNPEWFKVKSLIIEDELTNPVYMLKNTSCAFAVSLLTNLYVKKKTKGKTPKNVTHSLNSS